MCVSFTPLAKNIQEIQKEKRKIIMFQTIIKHEKDKKKIKNFLVNSILGPSRQTYRQTKNV